MTLRTHLIIQVAITLLQSLPRIFPILDGVIALEPWHTALSGVQAALAGYAQHSNTDGTPQSTPKA